MYQRLEAGYLRRRLQRGELLGMHPCETDAHDRARCYVLRVNEAAATWRIIYRVDEDAIVIAEVFSKKTASTPRRVIAVCKNRLREYDSRTRPNYRALSLCSANLVGND